MTIRSIAFSVAIVAVYAFEYSAPCAIKKLGERPEVIKTPLKKLENLPSAFDWGNVDGVNYLTNIR